MACRANKTAAVFLIASLKPCEVFSTKGGEQEGNSLSGQMMSQVCGQRFQLVDYL